VFSRSEVDQVATTMPDVGPQVREHIEVRGAREHNLRGVDVDIPKRGLTVFTGVSGSGKSSLVFDTIAAESQRLINETYTTFLQSFMATPARPDVDELRNLTAAVVVDQEPMGANARSTVGTATDAYAMLRPLYSRIGTPQVGGAGMFSFNEPQGMCPDCEGLGRAAAIDVDALVDRDRTLREGPVDFPNFRPGELVLADLRRVGLLRPGHAAARLGRRALATFPARPRRQDRARRLHPDLRGAAAEDPAAVHGQGRRVAAAAHPPGRPQDRDVRAV
jgi:hypothetical protein